ncbi:protein angel homolog 2-like isoform X2 [Lytechinus pictus]|uniref:protein angel homolog 2-like isoform X2 n=1 Tax=Lytechinus pictus TaxID=7653 RepID=UPI0030B9B68D
MEFVDGLLDYPPIVLSTTAMVPRHILNSAHRFNASQLSNHQSLIQRNHRALSFHPWYNLSPTSWTWYNNPLFLNYLQQTQQRMPIHAQICHPLRTPHYSSYYNERMPGSMNMERSSEMDPQRRRTSPGFHPYSRSNLSNTREMDPSEQASSRKSNKYNSRTSSSQGFTQANWPTRTEDCEWRRGPRKNECTQNQVRNMQIDWPKHLTVTFSRNRASSKSVSFEPDSKKTAENTAPVHHPRSHSQPCSGSALPPNLAFQPSCNFHSSTESRQASKSGTDSTSTYRKRLWFNVPQQRGNPSSKLPGKCCEFSIVSYNVLAQGLLDTNYYLYRHCDQDILLWNHRRQRILEEIQKADADIICLQEVEERHFHDFFYPALQARGYASIYKKRTGDKEDGCATFYRMNRFYEVSHTKLEYQRGIGLMDRDNVAIVVMLQPRGMTSSHKLCVANTHLLWNPRRGDIKLAQLGLLFAEIERLSRTNHRSRKNTYHPVILCGDFNSVPHCPLYKFIKNGQVTYEGLASVEVSGQELGRAKIPLSSPLWPKELGVTPHCRYADAGMQSSRNPGGTSRRTRQSSRDHPANQDIQIDDIEGQLVHPFLFSSVYDHSHGNTEVTTNHSKTNCTVDYIFYSKHIKEGSTSKHLGTSNFSGELSLVGRLNLFTDSEVSAMGGLPNLNWASDHLSLQATLRLTPVE